MEKELLGVSLRSRQDYALVKNYIDVHQKGYSKHFQVLMGMVGNYYARDDNAQHVEPEVLMAQVEETLRNQKHTEVFHSLVSDAVASSHDANVRTVILSAKEQEIGDRLAVALTSSGGAENVDELIEELKALRSVTSLEQLEDSGLEVYSNIDLESLMNKTFDPANLIKLYPASLNDRIDGGAKRGHHIIVYGRPESMKTGTVINMNCGVAHQGFKSLYFINEDHPDDLIIRHVTNLSGMTKGEMRDNPRRAERLAYDRGFGNIIIVSAAPGTLGQLSAYVDKYQPDVIIVDQLRNLRVKAESRVNQLDMAAAGVRNIAKEANVLAISVTQAGDSAEGKAVLDMGDVDFSNTGIPGAADLMIGVGVTPEMEAENVRMFSLPKNKLSGDHSSFPVRVIPPLSKVRNV